MVALAAGVQCFAAWRAMAAFEPARIGQDAASLLRARYAGLRAELPAGAFVRLLREERQLGADEQAMIDRVAIQLHRCLADQPMEPLPGIEAGFVAQIAAGFRRIHSLDENRDLAAVQRNLAAWWTGLAGEQHLSSLRYSLAPHVVANSASAWVVADFPAAYDWREQAARAGLEVVRDFGDGAVLFRGRP
jgi:hypothetical protein